MWGNARDDLKTFGHDVVWAGDWEVEPGDEEILAQVHQEGRVLVTLDKDFGELAIVRELPHSGIIRLVNIRDKQPATFCIRVLQSYSEEIQAGALITVDRNRVRIRIWEVRQTS